MARFVILGGGPAGNTAATYAARLGAEVTLVERDVLGGAAHLWDCIPSKTMIATGGAISFTRRIAGMGLEHVDATLDVKAQRERVVAIEQHLNSSLRTLLDSQGVRLIRGTARLKGPHDVVVDTESGMEELEADAILVATGSRPRIPVVGAARRRAGADDPPGLPAADHARPSGRHRLGGDRGRVRAHVLVLRAPA